MELDPRLCYRALQTRDARFDGRFFVGVRTTGVYCRPICPARTPHRRNCVFLPCAAAAQAAGFRPCLRCRPEASTGTPAWLGTSATVSRALRLIAAGALDQASVSELAARLGMGARQLRRLFTKHLGASPVAIAQTRRVLFAKKLLSETRLSMTEVALASGFSSVRRFNDAIRRGFRASPRQLRGANGQVSDGSVLTLRLAFRPPFDWSALVRFLEPRILPGVEWIDASAYRRTFQLDEVTGLVEVRPEPAAHHLVARLRLSDPRVLLQVTERLRRLFDLGADPAEIGAHLSRDPRLRHALQARPGLRVPGAWDGFELAVRAILGQQVSVKAAHTLARRLVEAYGEPLPADEVHGGLRFRFPAPGVLADADSRRLGIPERRAAALRTLAKAVACGELDLNAPPDPARTLERLQALSGVGKWTAQYVALRALCEPDAFPAEDLALRRALAGKGPPLHGRELLFRAERWRPWRGYAAMLLWEEAADATSV